MNRRTYRNICLEVCVQKYVYRSKRSVGGNGTQCKQQLALNVWNKWHSM